MRISEAIEGFGRQMAANGRSGHTKAAYARDLRVLARWLADNPKVDKITPDALARFLISDMVLCTPDGRPREAISVNRTKSALRAFFAFCQESGFVQDNPARLIRSSPTAVKEPSSLTEGEITRIREVLTAGTGPVAARDRLIFELLLGTGIRLGSLVALNTGDIDLASGTMHITAKGGGIERVFLNPALVAMLGDHLQESATRGDCGTNTALIRARGGGRLGARQVQLRFGQWVAKAGIARSLSVHSVRHTFATRLYQRTGDLYLVQRALGHRQITTTEIYARVGDEVLRRAMGSV